MLNFDVTAAGVTEFIYWVGAK